MPLLRKTPARNQRASSAIVVLIVGSVLGTGALAAGVSYLQTFDGTPATPQPLRPLIDWDVTVHSRDIATWYAPEAMQGQHGSDCAAPPAVHPVSSYEDTVFICNGHVMTALYAEGYGVIYLTPNQLVDFSTGEATIRFDVSTARTSPRDWIDLWISPYDQHLQLPLEDWLPDLNGPPRNAIHIRMDNTSAASPSGSMFRTVVYRNFVGQEVSTNNVSALENVVTPSAVVRSTFQLTISRTHLKFGMPAQNLWWMDGDIPDLGWMQGVVQLGHHSYNPAKCDPQVACSPNTWHWDNVQLSSAVPFTILRGDQRYVDPTTSPQVTFPAPAPQNARLRFAGVGNNLAVSFDGGATWQAAQLQAQEKQDVATFQSYWTPIPAGTTSVQVRGQGGWWGSQWMVRDISLWAASALQPVSP